MSGLMRSTRHISAVATRAKMRYGALVAALGIAIVTGVCGFTGCFRFYRRTVEIVPGLKWQYCSDRFSRLIWDKFGVVAEGRLDLTFCEQGLYIHSRDDDRSLYLDLMERRVVKGKNCGSNMLGYCGLSIDAPTAMGVYTNDGKILFEQALKDLKKRLKRNSTDSEDVHCTHGR